jgi:hypothetical protein
MIRLRIAGPNFEDIIAKVDQMAHPDLTPLAQTVRQIMLNDNRRGLLAGTDWNDDAMPPVEPITMETRGGDGPPLIPHSESSAISDYDVEIEQGDNRLLLIGGWRNTPFIHFHVTGTRHMVARDPTGIRAQGQAEIAEALNEFATNLVAGGQP